MKKEAIAGAVLALLIALSAWNIYSIDALTDGIGDSLRMSQALADIGDFDSAKIELDKGLRLWLNADGYTHIFLRHPEIDSTTDAFYALQQVLMQEDITACADHRGLAVDEQLPVLAGLLIKAKREGLIERRSDGVESPAPTVIGIVICFQPGLTEQLLG